MRELSIYREIKQCQFVPDSGESGKLTSFYAFTLAMGWRMGRDGKGWYSGEMERLSNSIITPHYGPDLNS